MSDTMKRENGFYWVTFHSVEAVVLGLNHVETRVVAEYFNGGWFVTACQFEVSEGNEITEISEAKIAE